MSVKELVLFELAVDELDAGECVLDLGCGTGRPFGVELDFRGLRVFGVDESEEMLKYARHNVPSGEFAQDDIATFRSSRRFPAVIMWDALFHIESSLHAEILERVAGCLDEGGRLMLSSGGSVDADTSGGFCDTMFGHRFYYDSLSPDRLLRVLAGCGLSPMLHSMINDPDGDRDRGRFAGVFRKTHNRGIT
jgi:SAM-dependent methyltransferase